MTMLTRNTCVAVTAAVLLIGFLPEAVGHEVSLSCPTGLGPVPDASGLIAYYPLDGDTADASGNGMDAIEVNAVEAAEGKVGQGYRFNGKDSFIRLPLDISPYVYSQVTITAWVKPEILTSARYIVNQGDHGNRSLFISNGAVSAGSALVGNGKHTVYADRWVFVALSYDEAAGTAVLLSNATFSAVDKVVIPDLPRPSVLLGAKAPGNSGFAGIIDEVRIYDRALTATELAALKAESRTTGPTNSGSLISESSDAGADACAAVTCSADQVCVNGGCFYSAGSLVPATNTENACANVSCPTGQVCVNGGCFDSADSLVPTPDATGSALRPSPVDSGRTVENPDTLVSDPGTMVSDPGTMVSHPGTLDRPAAEIIRESSSAQPGIPSYGDNQQPDDRELTTAELAALNEESQMIGPFNSKSSAPLPTPDATDGGLRPAPADSGRTVDNPDTLVSDPGTLISDPETLDRPAAEIIGETSSAQPGIPSYGDNPQPDDASQLTGGQSQSISAEDIPTSPEYQMMDQTVVLDVTAMMPDTSDETRTGQPQLSRFVYAPGEAQLTAVSGRAGSIVQVHMDPRRSGSNPDPDTVGTYAWHVAERYDKLCEIITQFAVVRECRDGNRSSKTARFNLATSRVTAIQLCTRRSNDRVKGVRIRGLGLSRTAASGLDNAWEQAELSYANCNDNWKALVMCPSGQIAAGLKAHFDPGTGLSKNIPALVGIQLFCRALTLVPVS